MKGQSSAELMILVGGILIMVTSLVYLGLGSNESSIVLGAARDGAENAVSNLSARYGCAIDIDNLVFNTGTITVSVAVRDAPPDNFTWADFRDNVVAKRIREAGLKMIQNAVGGHIPSTAAPVKTSYYTYDVAVNARQVTK